jgi:hypothetical protein
VGEIVDRAQKELIIEKQLKKIEDIWVNLDIQFVMWEEGNELQLPKRSAKRLKKIRFKCKI